MSVSSYFTSYENYFWQWEDKANVIAVPGSFTIAFKEYLLEVFGVLGQSGTPPFGSLLLALIATNPNRHSDLNSVYSLINKFEGNQQSLDNAIVFLKTLSDVPERFLKGKMRLILLQSIFTNCHNSYSIKKSSFIKSQLKRIGDHSEAKKPFHIGNFNKDITVIALLKQKYPSVNSIIDSLAGSLDGTLDGIQELDFSDKLDSTGNTLIDQLISNGETYCIGSLIKRIWGGINIPFHSNLPSQQPLGGIADITNKGDFDKLLISEFANDDLLFLSRLANNETMYYNREIPSGDNNLKRLILIDSTLKNWGIIKTLSFALSIAIAHHPKSKLEYSVFVLGKDFTEININEIDEIIDSLQKPDCSLNANEGFVKFLKNTNILNKEIFYIGSNESASNQGFQKLLSDTNCNIDFWIHPDTLGNITIYLSRNRQKKNIQNFLLPFKEIWRQSRKNLKSINIKNESIATSTYPILFNEPQNLVEVLTYNDGTSFKITKCRKVFKVYNKLAIKHTKGWDLVCDNLAKGYNSYTLGKNELNEFILLLFNKNNNSIDLLNLNTKLKQNFNLVTFVKKRCAFCFYENFFYCINDDSAYKIEMNGSITHEKRGELLKNLNSEINKNDKVKNEIKEKLKKNYIKKNVLKKIDKVYINQDSNLVFNQHVLYLNAHRVLKIDYTSSSTIVHSSNRNADYEFEFKDRSIVFTNSAGLITLISSDKTIPTIYLPSMIDQQLGAATADCFTGNIYFQKSNLYNLYLKSYGADKIGVIKCLRKNLNIGLKEVNNMIDGSQNKMIATELDEITAKTIVKELANIGCKSSFVLDYKEQSTIEVREFYLKFINAFIENILKNAN